MTPARAPRSIAAWSSGSRFVGKARLRLGQSVGASLFAAHPDAVAADGRRLLASRVHKIKIALLGPIVSHSNPVRLAEELAMLDTMADGRLVVGLLRGTTNEALTYDLNPQESRERTDEGMELILKAWTEPQPFGWQGRHFRYRTVSVWPRPLQQPHPPTYRSRHQPRGRRVRRAQPDRPRCFLRAVRGHGQGDRPLSRTMRAPRLGARRRSDHLPREHRAGGDRCRRRNGRWRRIRRGRHSP